MSDTRPLHVAFIGAGQMAGLHLDALRAVKTPHTVVGVHDLSRSAAQQFAERAGARAYATPQALLAEARPSVVHICTPLGKHFEPARDALLAGAHVYVEKPFVETLDEADTLSDLARERGLLICTGHQLMRDPAFGQTMRRAEELQPVTLVDSYFAFRPPRLDPDRSSHRALGQQLLDVLPHPLYTLLLALEAFSPAGAPVDVAQITATPTDLHALMRMGDVHGRLCVSLRARPVASTLTVTGAQGTLTTDFVRAIVLGAANEGTSPLEKIANPFLEAAQLTWRSGTSLAKRLAGGGHYPGLVELLEDFYFAALTGRPSPVASDHLRRVTAIYAQCAARVRRAVDPDNCPTAKVAMPASGGPLAVVTGAAGFFGRAINRELARRGFRVRGIGRSERPDDPHVHDWIRADLANAAPPGALADASIVVHAAAETAGGFEAHERNTVATTQHLLDAMAAAGVRRLVHVSSISVLTPPRGVWERQSEATPIAASAEQLGPYTWGKCAAEELVATTAAASDLEVRILRPAALIDWEHIEVPGLLGRRLFGHWHLGLGRPGLPFAVCEVGQAGAAVAWCAEHFVEAPSVINLFDPAIGTRAQLLERFRERGWRGRVVWVPISLLAGGMMLARRVLGLLRRERVRSLAVWSVLRPRRYDPAITRTVLAAAATPSPLPKLPTRARLAELVSEPVA